jgi:hypothetical protein
MRVRPRCRGLRTGEVTIRMQPVRNPPDRSLTFFRWSEFDRSVPATFDQLYGELTGVPDGRRLMVTVQCAGHYMVWERQSKVLFHISKQWLKHGTVDDHASGKFFVDTEGVIRPY